MNFIKKKNFLKEAIQSRLDKYNKDNNVTEDLKHLKSNKSINNNNITTRKNEDKNIENNNLETKFTADKETMLSPYFIDNEKNEKKNEDSTKDCLTINKLLVHPFYAETQTTETFLKDLFNNSLQEKN